MAEHIMSPWHYWTLQSFRCDGRPDVHSRHAGYTDAAALARREADLALSALSKLPVCDERRSLESMVDYVLERIY